MTTGLEWGQRCSKRGSVGQTINGPTDKLRGETFIGELAPLLSVCGRKMQMLTNQRASASPDLAQHHQFGYAVAVCMPPQRSECFSVVDDM